MTNVGTGDLHAVLAPWPNLGRLAEIVLACWPEHAAYLRKSFAVRTPDLMSSSDHVAGAVLALAGERAAQVAQDYRWLSDQIREAEIAFARTGRYRFSSFAETNAHVYSDDAFMQRYMHGLLFSHVLWFMHASSLLFFRQRLAARVMPGGRVLEVGSGHGLLLYLALTDLGLAEAHGWDLTEVSLAQTQAALALLGIGDRAHFRLQDMHQVAPEMVDFDLVILSHILEHLDDPVAALVRMRGALAKGGKLFVNVPLNAPMPDHVILLRTPEEAAALLRDGGFHILELATHTTQGATLAKALKRQTAVTCSFIAEPA